MQDFIDRYAAHGFTLTVDLAELTASARKPKTKKFKFNYKFKSPKQLAEFVAAQAGLIEREQETKANNKKLQQEALKNHSLEVGTIVYSSWGFNQTNIDFFQVIRRTKSSVVIQEIDKKTAPNKSEGFMCRHVVPVKDKFTSTETIMKKVNVLLGSHKPHFYLSHKYGSYSVYDRGDDGCYESWYA